jgi:integrase
VKAGHGGFNQSHAAIPQEHSPARWAIARARSNGDVWSLPPHKTKNRKGHDVPLSRQAPELIEAMPDVGDVIFTTADGARPIRNFSRIKLAVDEIMKPEQPFVWHDLRRTRASGMARLGVQLPVIEKVLNHSSGTFRGIVAVYQRHDFATEKRDALARWSDHVEAVVKGEPASGKVVKLRR